MNKIILEKIARRCKAYRKYSGKTLEDVARWTGYSISSISAFESGQNNNAIIYDWYITFVLPTVVEVQNDN